MAHVAVDLDGTISAAPQQMQELCSALMAAGHTVTVLTGTQGPTATKRDYDEKANFLNSLGMGQSYNSMTVLASSGGDLAQKKALWCKDNSVDVLIDNSKANAREASKYVPLVLVPWASRV